MYKILVIDDDMDICNLLERFLSKKGHVVKTAFTSNTALALIEQENFDVVLSDFRLGSTDGKLILQKVKEKLDSSLVRTANQLLSTSKPTAKSYQQKIEKIKKIIL